MFVRSRLLLLGVLLAVGSGLVLPASADTYQVKVYNMIPGGPDTGQPFTPAVVVVHDAGYSLFTVGDYATPGLALVAEEGDPTDLIAEAMASPSVFAVEVAGSGPFFDEVMVEISGNPGDLLSIAFMLARTNDLFSGVADMVLPAADSLVVDPTEVWDAGTEVNTGLIEDIPFYGNHFVGPDENNPIMPINFYEVLNDPTYGLLTWDFPPAARIVVTALGPTPTAENTWGSIKGLFR